MRKINDKLKEKSEKNKDLYEKISHLNCEIQTLENTISQKDEILINLTKTIYDLREQIDVLTLLNSDDKNKIQSFVVELTKQYKILIDEKEEQIVRLKLKLKKQGQFDPQIQSQPKSKLIFDIYQMVKIANSDKKRFHEKILGTIGISNYVNYDDLQELLDTLPTTAIETLNEFLQRHQVFQTEFFGGNNDPLGYIFDMKGASFDGPFVYYDGRLCIQQKNTDRPMFLITWNPANWANLQVIFYKIEFDKYYKEIWVLTVQKNLITLKDNSTNTTFHSYQVNLDGSLGDKIT